MQTRERSVATMAHFQAELAERGYGWWAVEVVAIGTFNGMAALDPVEDGMPVSGIEIGWRLARSAWGHGYATDVTPDTYRAALVRLHR